MMKLRLCLLLLLAGRAAAEEPPAFVGLGVYGRAISDDSGIGAEISVHVYPHWSEHLLGLGAFAQLEAAGLGDPSAHVRATAGAQAARAVEIGGAAFGLGAEVGFCFEDSTAARAGALELHVAPFVSFYGIIAFSLVLDAPLAGLGSGPSRDVGFGFAVALKLPIPLHRFGQGP